MKLLMTEGSPFARKVRILAREKSLAHRIQEVVVAVSPVRANDAVARENPLAQIPVLILDSGERLYDSRVICDYVDTLHAGECSFPASGPERFRALRQLALCDGILDAAILCRYELALRPAGLRWDDWVDGQKRKILGGLAQLEAEVDDWSDAFGMAQIGAVCVVGYLDFRFADWAWRAAHPRLSGWHRRVAQRPSVLATTPTDSAAAPATEATRHASAQD